MVYKMTSNRIAFASAIGLAVLALFVLNGAEAGEFTGTPSIFPNDSRVNADQDMNFIVEFDDKGSAATNLVVKVWFDAVDHNVTLECSDCLSGSTSGNYTILTGVVPTAEELVTLVGSEEIAFGFIATYDENPDGNHWPGQGDNCIPGINCDHSAGSYVSY